MRSPHLSFATWVCSHEEEQDALLLVESLRAFGGTQASAPVRIYAPRILEDRHDSERLGAFRRLGAELIHLPMDEEILDFWYAFKTLAAGRAEAEAGAEILVWMDPDTIFLKVPSPFLLPEGIHFGYRPVYVQGIASPWDRPLEGLWKAVYQDLAVPESRPFPMRPVCSDLLIRPYFNAGLLVVRPEKGLLRAWGETFLKLCHLPPCTATYENESCKIFVHQVVLSALLLGKLDKTQMLELPPTVNASLKHRDQYRNAPPPLEDCITLRTEWFFTPGWEEVLPAALRDWIHTHRR